MKPERGMLSVTELPMGAQFANFQIYHRFGDLAQTIGCEKCHATHRLPFIGGARGIS